MESADFRMAEAENISAEPDPTPRRRRGRPAGLGKVPGSGRKKGSTRVALDDMLGEAESFLLDVLAGKQFYAGPGSSVGKAGWQYPSATMRMKAALALLDRAHPTLTAAKIESDVTTHGDGVEHDPRHLARSVIELFRSAVEADDPTATFGVAPPGETLVRVPESVAADYFPSEPRARPMLPDVGDTEAVGDCTLVLAEIGNDGRERWKIHSASGEPITGVWGKDRARAAAEEFIATGRVTA